MARHVALLSACWLVRSDGDLCVGEASSAQGHRTLPGNWVGWQEERRPFLGRWKHPSCQISSPPTPQHAQEKAGMLGPPVAAGGTWPPSEEDAHCSLSLHLTAVLCIAHITPRPLSSKSQLSVFPWVDYWDWCCFSSLIILFRHCSFSTSLFLSFVHSSTFLGLGAISSSFLSGTLYSFTGNLPCLIILKMNGMSFPVSMALAASHNLVSSGLAVGHFSNIYNFRLNDLWWKSSEEECFLKFSSGLWC